MRKFFYGFGLVMACLVVAGAIGLFVLARNGAALDAESKAYVEDSVVAIGAHWDAAALWQRSTPHFRAVTKQEDLRAFFDAANGALGPLTEYRGASGGAIIAMTNAKRSTTANYAARATFEKGNAEFEILAIKNGAEWQIEGFHINSNALMKSLVGLRS